MAGGCLDEVSGMESLAGDRPGLVNKGYLERWGGSQGGRHTASPQTLIG